MRPLEDFFPAILRYAPQAPEPLVESLLRETARDFCQRTRCWREKQTIETIGDENEISCTPPDADIFEIEEAWFDGRKLDRVSFSDVPADQWPVYPASSAAGGVPSSITQLTPNTFTLIPAGAGSLCVSIFFQPSHDAENLPDVLFDQFMSVIAKGTAAALLLLPAQLFTNPALASVLLGEFNSAADRNFSFNRRGQQRAATRSTASWV